MARVGRGTRATVGVPGARRELQAAREAVTGADRPVSTRLALRDGVPVHAVRLANGRGRRSVRRRRRRNVRVEAHRSRWRRGVRRRRRRNVGVEAHRGGRPRRQVNRRQSVRHGGRRRNVRVEAHGSRRRGVRSRWRGRIRGSPGGLNVRVKAHNVRACGRGWHARERPCDRGEDERLADVLQISSFRGARAKAIPRCGFEVLGPCGIAALGRADWFWHGSGGPGCPAGRYPSDAARLSPSAVPAHTRIRGFNFR